jgi:hypothetical protein
LFLSNIWKSLRNLKPLLLQLPILASSRSRIVLIIFCNLLLQVHGRYWSCVRRAQYVTWSKSSV